MTSKERKLTEDEMEKLCSICRALLDHGITPDDVADIMLNAVDDALDRLASG